MSTESQALEVEVVTPESKAELVVKTSGLDATEIQPLQASFAPLFNEARTILEQSRAVQVTDASQELQMKLSRTYRLALRKVRTGADSLRKDLKEASIRRGRAIDGFFNILLDMTEAEEARLAEGEQFAERKALERRNALNAERTAALAAYGMQQLTGLGDMEEATWLQLLENTKAGHEAKQEAARKAEAARIEAENLRLAEEARVRAENERLKAEAAAAAEAARIEREKLEAAAAEERRKAEAAKKAAAAKAKAERDAIEAKAKAEAEAAARAAKAEADRLAEVARVEREAREKAEAEAQALRDAEAKRLADEAEAARQASLAPDKEKLQALAVELRSFGMPALATKDGQGVVELLSAKLDKLAAWIDEEASAL